MTGELAAAYNSGSQRARVVTEAWGEQNLYCPNCSSPKLSRLSHNTKANDFLCPSCGFSYQLKGQKSRIGNSVRDGAYGAMMAAIQNDQTPNFFFMHYDLATWSIKNLLLIPYFAFPLSAIIKGTPLSATARRSGWIGCNIALNRIPAEARIAVVTESRVLPENGVREQFKRIKPFVEIKGIERGWLLDVLNIVNRLSKKEFSNEDVYAFAGELTQLYPQNKNIKAKIRQKLQELRDRNLLLHIGRNRWRTP